MDPEMDDDLFRCWDEEVDPRQPRQHAQQEPAKAPELRYPRYSGPAKPSLGGVYMWLPLGARKQLQAQQAGYQVAHKAWCVEVSQLLRGTPYAVCSGFF
jgi:hypothetical protein